MPEEIMPKIEKTIDVLELAPDKLLLVHTKVHVIWNGIESGLYFDNWNLEDCKRIHDDILSKLKEYNLPHIRTSSKLDGDDEETAEEQRQEEVSKEKQLKKIFENRKELEKIKQDIKTLPDLANLVEKQRKLIERMIDMQVFVFRDVAKQGAQIKQIRAELNSVIKIMIDETQGRIDERKLLEKQQKEKEEHKQKVEKNGRN